MSTPRQVSADAERRTRVSLLFQYGFPLRTSPLPVLPSTSTPFSAPIRRLAARAPFCLRSGPSSCCELVVVGCGVGRVACRAACASVCSILRLERLVVHFPPSVLRSLTHSFFLSFFRSLRRSSLRNSQRYRPHGEGSEYLRRRRPRSGMIVGGSGLGRESEGEGALAA